MELKRSSIKIFGSGTANAILVFVGIALFARELSASQLGAFFLFEALLGMLAIPTDFGVRGAVEKRISEGEPMDPVFSTAVLMKTFSLAVVVMGIYRFRGYIDTYLGAPVAIYLAIGLVLSEFAQLTVYTLRGELRVGETALLTVCRQAVWLVVGGVLVASGKGMLGLVYGLLTGYGAMLVLGLYKISITLTSPKKEYVQPLISYSKFHFVSSVGGYFYSWMDVAIIGLLLTQADVGAYEVAWRVTAIVMLFSKAIATTIFPQVSSWDAEGATEQIEQLIPELITPSLLFVIPAFFGTLLLSQEILELIFGSEYTIASLVLIILMAEKLLQAPHLILGRALQGIDRPDLAARAGVFAMLLNLVLNVSLVGIFGLVGAAVATAISFAVNSILHARYLSRFVAISVPFRELGWCVVASVGMSIILLAVTRILTVDSLFTLVLVITAGAIIYCIFLLPYRPIRQMALSWSEKLL